MQIEIEIETEIEAEIETEIETEWEESDCYVAVSNNVILPYSPS